MKTKITLGKPVKGKVSRSVYDSVSSSVRELLYLSADVSLYNLVNSSVAGSIYWSINDSIKFRL
jgi:hypothetical protein